MQYFSIENSIRQQAKKSGTLPFSCDTKNGKQQMAPRAKTSGCFKASPDHLRNVVSCFGNKIVEVKEKPLMSNLNIKSYIYIYVHICMYIYFRIYRNENISNILLSPIYY